MRHALLIAFSLFSVQAYAAKGHSHGEAQLNVAIDKGQISLTLELPLDAAVGFERAPKSDKEKAALAAAEQTLRDTGLFVPTAAAQCSAQPVELQMPQFSGEHADLEATYRFQCAAPAALKGIETHLFKHFKRLYRIEAQRVGPMPGSQGKQRLTPKAPVLSW